MGKLFGTDGIRGKAGHYPITSELAHRVGQALACQLKASGNPMNVVVGRDTRASGPMLEDAIAAGIASAGARVLRAGVLPTPAVAYLCRSLGAGAGIVVSASHNPYQDNGIKVFNAEGRKVSLAEEDELEALILAEAPLVSAPSTIAGGTDEIVPDAPDRYQSFLLSTVTDPQTFKDLRVVLDCANGATSAVAPALFGRLGARVETMSCRPDGTNINAGCGSEHPQRLCHRVVETKARIGVAFDGDGDRLVAVDETGRVVNGDQVLAILAKHLKNSGRLMTKWVVATVMSNIGLSLALKSDGIELLSSDVGDRHVMEQMMAAGAVFGGENSGHVIFADRHSTGDGLLSALELVAAMAAAPAASLSCLAAEVPMFPQALINVAVKTKPEIATVAPIKTVIDEAQRQLGEKGRVLVRYSGTQSICRVMVEGPTEDQTKALCSRIAEVIQKAIG